MLETLDNGETQMQKIERPYAAHLAAYYAATRTFEKFWAELKAKEEAGR